MRLLRALAPLFLGLTLATASAAQDSAADAALLVADQVFVEGQDRLIATGNVEALYDGTRLAARRIIYDRTSDSLTLEGPIRITDQQGNILVADSGEIDSAIENGLLRGARVVLDQQLQLAAVEARRVEGRFTQLSRVAVTSCQVCGDTSAPLWSIRASRVVHDQQERQLYFENAQLRVLDVPIFYVPYLRLPDPSLERARGFLIPTFRSTTLLGFGIKTPYFIPIGDHRDLTLTPYLSTVTRTLEARYRQAFRHGDIELNGAITQDSLISDGARGYLFAKGAFSLPRDFRLSFNIEATTDNAYLNDYDYASADRLESDLTVSRFRRDGLASASLRHYESLRDGDSNATQPSIVGTAEYERRYFPRAGGEFRVSSELHNHFRYSTLDVDSADADTLVDGRDVTRLNTDLSWRNRWTLSGGVRAAALGELWIDRFWVSQDSTRPADVSQVTPSAAVELRWPWARAGVNGARWLVEPVAQAGWIGGDRVQVTNDESTRPEFDEGNLLSLSRFPAADRRERGYTGALGLRMLRDNPAGLTTGLTLGRVWREEDDADFTRSSGLSTAASDWLLAGHIDTSDGLVLSARGLFNVADMSVSKAEARAIWTRDRMNLGASYVLLVTDSDENRDQAQSEWSFDGKYQFTTNWAASTDMRYDLVDRRFAKAGIDLEYQNECAVVNFSVSRRYASSDSLEPSTDFGLTVALKGFSTGGSAGEYRRSCR
ncbi:LPS-assembly protein LptD [Puniceibacterium confluentis]|uniref:LPS-assembly protein LptD n=1 Tax=Puniceibacterium confluentis TaxID=1958944 RepID=UPI0011B5014D|nr:LPS assembly protein LptD [Puniceibacterium confluentis]